MLHVPTDGSPFPAIICNGASRSSHGHWRTPTHLNCLSQVTRESKSSDENLPPLYRIHFLPIYHQAAIPMLTPELYDVDEVYDMGMNE